MSALTKTKEWQVLQAHFEAVKNTTIRQHFDLEPDRFGQFSMKLGKLFVDYSKHRMSSTTLKLLIDLAQACELGRSRDNMFSGDHINYTENRSVLHIALRNLSNRAIRSDGQDVMPLVKQELQKMATFCNRVRTGEWKGYSGMPITDVINIGIGGSDLGPKMAVSALSHYISDRLKFHFIANVDGEEINAVLGQINPETCLFIVESKTFTTQETLTNAFTARQWLVSQLKNSDAIANHFVAVSVNKEAVVEFGIDEKNIFEFWDWVGGRYSMWSAIGLPIMLAIGEQAFNQFLAGAHLVDEHFRTQPFESNLPVIMALIGIWYTNFYKASTHGVFPYAYNLRFLPQYLQQAEMESNGKYINHENRVVDYCTAPVLWGSTGVNSQHATFQLLHQGTHLVPADFIVSLTSNHHLQDHQNKLFCNCIAQTEALMCGKSEDIVISEMRQQGLSEDRIAGLVKHRTFPGNRPSTTLLLDELDPESLGSLVALYEHKIFVQGVIWGINSFDQWGVELGKAMANKILSELENPANNGHHDPSTSALIEIYKKYNT